MKTLQLGPEFTLPPTAITETFAILAARGAGKSNTAAVMAEEMFRRGLPFVVIDPVRAWWGLRSASDGENPGLSIPIFGGPHGDVPLERGGGNLTADLVVDQRLSCVLDLSNFDSEGSKKVFLLDFARRLYQRNEHPLHIFMEEADDYIPQKPIRDEVQLLRAWENIVRRGRSRGLGMTMITQRSASINKNVLTQAQTLIAMRTTGPQDIAAIREWVKYHQQSEKIVESLASLKDGEAWVWSPIFLGETRKVRVRRRWTYDSGATPKMGDSAKPPATLADIDLAGIKKRMAATIERAKAEDPKELRRKITELERALATRNNSGHKMPAVSPKLVEVPVLKDAQVKRLEVAVSKADVVADRVIKKFADVQVTTQGMLKAIEAFRTIPKRVETAIPPRPIEPARPRPVLASTGPGEALGRMETAILTALAQHPDGLQKGRLLLHAGYASSGPTSKCFAELARRGWIEGAGGLTRITREGATALGSWEPLPVGKALQDQVLGKLDRMEGSIMRVLFDAYPEPLPKGTILEKTGYASSGPTSKAFAKLVRIGYAVPARPGLRAAEEFFA